MTAIIHLSMCICMHACGNYDNHACMHKNCFDFCVNVIVKAIILAIIIATYKITFIMHRHACMQC